MIQEAVENNKSRKSVQILLIDDDPIFRLRMSSLGGRSLVSLTACSNLKEVDTMTVSRLFDVVIIDYYLDRLQRNLRGSTVAAVLEGAPILLISNTDHALEEFECWPNTIRLFMNKRVGYEAILDAAQGLCGA